jgi:hypothetical protein
MRRPARRSGITRRNFLRSALAGGAALAPTLWLARRGRGTPTTPRRVQRVLIVHAPGGVRWTASFDGQTDVQLNPWGILPWRLVGRGAPPAWGFSRMLLQKPLWQDATDWAGNLYPYLSSDDPTHYNVARPALATWKGATLPSLVDVAGRIAVVRVTGSPEGPFDTDHATASHTLYTGYRTGQAGLVTVLNDALRRQLGDSFDLVYPLPAVAVTQPGWSIGTGDLAASRPIFLASALALPTTQAGSSGGSWGRAVEAELDTRFAAARPQRDQQLLADFINDKTAADAHVPQLIDPALHLAESPAGASPALGALVDGTPLSNDMLAEVFGLNGDATCAGDLWRDIFAAIQSSAQPTWTAADNPFGLNGALAVRLLQSGAPVVSITVGGFDTHSYEVIDPYLHEAMTTQVASLGRLLSGLVFALQAAADPLSPSASLWDSTVVVTLSEFGRGGADVGPNGFNSQSGANDGGSGHDPWAAWPIFGGPVIAGGQLLTDAGGGFYQQNRIFTTLLKGLGVDAENSAYLPYDTFPPIPGLLGGV